MARVQHMVLVKFKPEVSPERIAELYSMIHLMKEKIPGIEYLDGGEYSSGEGMNQGYSHGFLITFSSAQARDAYLPHPEHDAVRTALLATIDAVAAFDFVETVDPTKPLPKVKVPRPAPKSKAAARPGPKRPVSTSAPKRSAKKSAAKRPARKPPAKVAKPAKSAKKKASLKEKPPAKRARR